MKYAFHGGVYDACWYAAWEGNGKFSGYVGRT